MPSARGDLIAARAEPFFAALHLYWHEPDELNTN